MEAFAIQLLGTDNYLMVVVGFLWSIIGLLYRYLNSDLPLSYKQVVINIFTIIICMRFSKEILSEINIGDNITAFSGIVIGFGAEPMRNMVIKILNKF
ncbi:MAG: hypothetical protein K1X55_17460 [Chitinophagales bacterium]|nr:hypothetical protein [Chitinophagales bacterium]